MENAGYERKDVKILTIIAAAVAIIAVLVIIIIILNDYFTAAKEEMVYNVYLKPESAEIREIRAHETEILTTYKVLDAEKNMYRIPIDRAMQLIAEENFQHQIKDR